MAKIVSLTVSVYPFRVERGRARYLLLRRAPTRKLAGAWQAVHGHVEKGETSLAAALRELREETGLAAEAVWAVDHLESFYEPRKDRIELVPCFGALVRGEPRLGDEHDERRWLDARKAAGLFTFENQRRAVARLEHDVARILARGGEPPSYLRLV